MLKYWTSGNGRIDLEMTTAQAQACSHPGRCDADVATLACDPRIAEQLNKINAALLRDELREYGAWDDEELTDHAQNLQRVMWIAAGDIADGQCD